MHEVRLDVLQELVVVGHYDGRFFRTAEGIDAIGHNPESVYIKAGVGFVENAEHRVQHCHLEYLVALFFAAGEAYVHFPLGKFLLHFEEGHLLFLELQEFAGLELREAFGTPFCIYGGLHESGDGDSGDLNGILETEEKAGPGAFFRGHCKKVLAHEGDAALCNGVSGTAGENRRQGAFACAVGAHHGMDFSGADCEVHPFEDFLVLNACVKVFYLKHITNFSYTV